VSVQKRGEVIDHSRFRKKKKKGGESDKGPKKTLIKLSGAKRMRLGGRAQRGGNTKGGRGPHPANLPVPNSPVEEHAYAIRETNKSEVTR